MNVLVQLLTYWLTCLLAYLKVRRLWLVRGALQELVLSGVEGTELVRCAAVPLVQREGRELLAFLLRLPRRAFRVRLLAALPADFRSEMPQGPDMTDFGQQAPRTGLRNSAGLSRGHAQTTRSPAEQAAHESEYSRMYGQRKRAAAAAASEAVAAESRLRSAGAAAAAELAKPITGSGPGGEMTVFDTLKCVSTPSGVGSLGGAMVLVVVTLGS